MTANSESWLEERKEEEAMERYPEIEQAILKVLEDQGGESDYLALGDSLPEVPIEWLIISLFYLQKDGIIEHGAPKVVESVVSCGNELVAGRGLSGAIFLRGK